VERSKELRFRPVQAEPKWTPKKFNNHWKICQNNIVYKRKTLDPKILPWGTPHVKIFNILFKKNAYLFLTWSEELGGLLVCCCSCCGFCCCGFCGWRFAGEPLVLLWKGRDPGLGLIAINTCLAPILGTLNKIELQHAYINYRTCNIHT